MFVPPRVRIKPITVIAGVVVMIAALLYFALNRSHEVRPQTPPMHQER
jgi:hypothetical protein